MATARSTSKPKILLSLVLLLIPLQNRIRTGVWWVCIAVFSISAFFAAKKNLEERYSESPMEINSMVYGDFKNAPSLLRDLDIDSEKKMLILDAYIPNMGLLLMDRNGFVVMTSSKKNIENALTWNYDYIIFQNNLFFDNVYSVFPEIINRIEVIGKNTGISIAVLKEQASSVELDEFLDLQEPIFEVYDDFNAAHKSNFDSTETSINIADNGVFVIEPEMEFALIQDWDLEDLGENTGGVLKIGMDFQVKKKGECHLVVTSNEGGIIIKLNG